jgi:hypothetical protein
MSPAERLLRRDMACAARARQSAAWRREAQRTRRHGAPNWTRTGTLKARLLARVASLLQIIGKGAES